MARRTLIGVGGIAMLLATVAGCGTLAPPTAWTPANRQPLILGWQQFFRIQWDGATRNGQTSVEGYITNTWGFPAQRIQLLITGYDATGQQLGQLIAWGPNAITPGGRRFFSVPVAPGASTYDVAMFAWNWVQTDGGANLQ
jgi:hypothetical protein